MKYLYFLSFYFLFNLIYAQKQQDNFTVKWLNSETGLKQLCVRQCVVDNNGFVWIATELGLFRYDGNSINEINEKKYPSLNKQRINRIGKDQITGKIYLETNPDGYRYMINDNLIEKLDTRKNTVFTLNETCYTNSNPIIRNIFKNSKIDKIIKEYSSINFLTANLTKNHLYLPQSSKIIQFDKNGIISDFKLSCTSGVFLMQFGESIIVADKKKATLIVNGKIAKKKIALDSNIHNYLNRSLINMSNMEIFGTTNNYFLKFRGKIFKIFYNKNKLFTEFLFNSPAEDISCITFLKKENVYLVGTKTQGIAVLRPRLFKTISFDVNATNKSINYCYSTVAISENKWYSASGWNYNPKKSKSEIADFLIDYRNTRFILPYNNKYYIQSKNDLWNIDNNKNDYDFIFPNIIKNKYIGLSGYAYHKGELYLVDPISIYHLKNKTLITNYNFYEKFVNSPINCIFSLNNSLLIGTIKGVYSYTPETKKASIVKGLENVNARYIKQINKNSFWVGCYGNGLYLVNQNKIYRVKDINIAITTAHAIEEDISGYLWISTNDGLLKTNKKEAITKILNNKPIECYKYSTENGLLTNEFNGSGTHPSINTKKGIIGFTSMKGFVWFHTKEVPMSCFKGSVIMNKILINNTKIISPIKNHYNLPKEAEIVSLNISYACHSNRENLTVAYRFEDQKKWTEMKENTFQIPRYKKGLHKLIIRISTHGFSDKEAVSKSFYLNFEPRYYELEWFWSLMVLVFIFILFITYRIGIFFSKKRENYLKERIKEQTVELELSIIDLEQSKESLDKSLKVKNILLKEIHHRVKNNLQLVMSILNIQASDKENTSIEGFIEKGQSRIASMVLIHENLYQKEDIGNIDFETYTESLVNNIRTTFGEISERIAIHINMKDVFFDVQTSIPLGLIINELVTNCFKHGFPNEKKGQITISIELLSGTNYKLSIVDSGIGFPKEKADKKSIGLELVSLLVLQLKGKLTIDSNNGTVFEIIFATP